jgi:hypothetical protein
MSNVMKARRIRRSASTWRRLFAKQVRSGLPVTKFCEREGVNAMLFRRWRAKLEPVAAVQTAGPSASMPIAPFIELGALPPESARFDIRLELGSGLVLSIARH